MGERSEESRKEIRLSLPLKKREKDKKQISTLVSSGCVTSLLQGSVIKKKIAICFIVQGIRDACWSQWVVFLVISVLRLKR